MELKNKKTEKVWFITGASRGFGRIWTEAALHRGDKVVATARDLESIAELKAKYGNKVLTLKMDVTQAAQVTSAVETAHDYFGRFDVIVNNAGYSLVGAIEECDLDSVRKLYETNVFGAVAVIQAVLPLLREQGFGHILGISSGLGHLAYPVIGYYCSSKWAFEAIHEGLAEEIKQFGIKVTIIEPGAYSTEFGSQKSLDIAKGTGIYDNGKQQFFEHMKKTVVQGNPEATPEAVFKVVDAENPPLRLSLGKYNLPEIRQAYSERLKTWEDWEEVSNAAQG